MVLRCCRRRNFVRITAISLRPSCSRAVRLAPAAQHLSGWRRQPPARAWNRGEGLTRPRPATRACGYAAAADLRDGSTACSRADRSVSQVACSAPLATSGSRSTRAIGSRRSRTIPDWRAGRSGPPVSSHRTPLEREQTGVDGRRPVGPDGAGRRQPGLPGPVRLHLHRLRDRPERGGDAGGARGASGTTQKRRFGLRRQSRPRSPRCA